MLLLSCGEGAASVETTAATDLPETEQLSAQPEGFRIADYCVVRSDLADKNELQATLRLRRALCELCGEELAISTDWDKNPVYDCEIQIGATLRPETAAVCEGMRQNDYSVTETDGGKRIVIAGGSVDALNKAVDYFLLTYFKYTGEGTGTKSETMPRVGEYAYDGGYLLRTLKIAGHDISECAIVYGDQSLKNYANYLAQSLFELTGVKPPVKTETPAGKTPIKLAVSTEKGWSVTFKDGATLQGSGTSEFYKAYKYFVTDCLSYGERASGGSAPQEVSLTSADDSK